MRCVVMFITAVCLIFLLKSKWPKNKSVYDLFFSGLGLLTLVTSLDLCSTEGGIIVWIDLVIGWKKLTNRKG